MKAEERDYLFLAVLAVTVIGVTVWTGSLVWYLSLILLCLFAGVLYATRRWHERGFFLICAGVPLMVACGAMSTWAGLVAGWMVAGCACNAMSLLARPRERWLFGVFCTATLPVALIVYFSNHVVVPIIILAVVTGAIVAVQQIRDHQWRKRFGVQP